MSSLSIALAPRSGGAFEGPFDVLLKLLRANEISIDDIPIPTITGQFLAYVKERKHTMEEELACEFIEVASWLVLLRSRAMVPQLAGSGANPCSGEMTPQEELKRALLSYEQIQQAAINIEDQQVRTPNRGIRIKTPVRTPTIETDAKTGITTESALQSAQRALQNARAVRSLALKEKEETATLTVQVRRLREILLELEAGATWNGSEWIRSFDSLTAQSTAILAILELAKVRELILHQHQRFGDVLVKRPGAASRP